MPGAKLIVMYPAPTDASEFERAYFDEHIPMASSRLKAGGATKVVLTRVVGSPAGPPAYHRVAEIHFPSADAIQSFAGSKAGQETVEHAQGISTGGALTVMVAEEEVVTL